jgi:CcmD family protein
MAAALGELPALPLHTAGKYVAAAYVVLFALVLVYVAIMAVRLSHIERRLGELLELSERPSARRDGTRGATPEAEEPDAVQVETTSV